MSEKVNVNTRDGAAYLGQALRTRITELREALESQEFDNDNTGTVRTRAALNELKDLIDHYEFPSA